MVIMSSLGLLILLKKTKIILAFFLTFFNNSDAYSILRKESFRIPRREFCPPSPSASITYRNVAANASNGALSACSGLNSGDRPPGSCPGRFPHHPAIWWKIGWRAKVPGLPSRRKRSSGQLKKLSCIGPKGPGGPRNRGPAKARYGLANHWLVRGGPKRRFWDRSFRVPPGFFALLPGCARG